MGTMAGMASSLLGLTLWQGIWHWIHECSWRGTGCFGIESWIRCPNLAWNCRRSDCEGPVNHRKDLGLKISALGQSLEILILWVWCNSRGNIFNKIHSRTLVQLVPTHPLETLWAFYSVWKNCEGRDWLYLGLNGSVEGGTKNGCRVVRWLQ